MSCLKFLLSLCAAKELKVLALFYNTLFWTTVVAPGKGTKRTLRGVSVSILANAFSDSYSEYDFALGAVAESTRISGVEFNVFAMQGSIGFRI